MVSLRFRFALAAAFLANAAVARLYHFPLVGRTDSHHRTLSVQTDPVDLDALYQARGVQYADLKVGA